MNIYTLDRLDTCGYDGYLSLCVIANSEDEAKALRPNSKMGDGDADAFQWPTDPNLLSCEMIGTTLSEVDEKFSGQATIMLCDGQNG